MSELHLYEAKHSLRNHPPAYAGQRQKITFTSLYVKSTISIIHIKIYNSIVVERMMKEVVSGSSSSSLPVVTTTGSSVQLAMGAKNRREGA